MEKVRTMGGMECFLQAGMGPSGGIWILGMEDV